MSDAFPDSCDPAVTSIGSVVLVLTARAESLTTLWSTVELGLSRQDVSWLKLWFSHHGPSCGSWLRGDKMETGPAAVTNRERLGLLLIVVAGEAAREDGDEDSLWRVVQAALPATHELRIALFPRGQPSRLCKEIISEAARRFRLRHALDLDDAQKYYETVRLQFGFTYRGAIKRLPDWLDGLGMPIAVQTLLGETAHPELAALSFRTVWEAMRNYRRGSATADEARVVLQRSAWLRRHWIEPLLQQAGMRRASVAPRVSAAPEAQQDGPGLVARVKLSWPPGGAPQLELDLNESVVRATFSGFETDQLIFAIDGRRVERWLRQGDGTWVGQRRLSCGEDAAGVPNLRPGLLTVSTKEGQGSEQVDLTQADVGIRGDVLVFDLVDGSLLPEETALETSRGYALVCEPDLALAGLDSHERSLYGSRKVYRLAPGWAQTAHLTLEDLSFWEPRIAQLPARESARIDLEGPEGLKLGSDCFLTLSGLPADARCPGLTIGRSRFELEAGGEVGRWKTVKPVNVDASLALGLERVRVEAVTSSGRRLYKPRLRLDLVGMAQLASDGSAMGQPVWRTVGQGVMDIAGGSGYVRVFTGGARVTEAVLYEGFALRARNALNRPVQVGKLGLEAWGAPLRLVLKKGAYEATSLVGATEDRDLVEGFSYFPQQRRPNPPRIWLRSPVDPDERHKLVTWERQGSKQVVAMTSPTGLSTGEGGRVWMLSEPPRAQALGLAFGGVRLGAWCNRDAIASGIREALLDHATASDALLELFALLRWFRVPVLSPDLRHEVQRAANKRPVDLVRAWLLGDGLPEGLHHRQKEHGTEAVVRDLLWKWEPRNPRTLEKILQALASCHKSPKEREGVGTLLAAARVCPPLLKGASMTRLSGEARGAALVLLDAQENAREDELASRLAALASRTQPRHDVAMSEGDQDRCRGETEAGRRYLAARILLASGRN